MITVVGSANMDLVARVPALPRPGETVLAREYAEAPGGKGANQAIAAARAGSEVAFVGRLGRDAHGRILRAGLEAAGISLQHLTLDPTTPSGRALIAVSETGENSIVVVPGANGQITAGQMDAAAETIAASQILVVQLEIPLAAVERAVTLAHDAGTRVILNPAPVRELPPSLYPLIDILVPNQEELAQLTGMGAPIDPAGTARMLVDTGIRAVVVTLGAQGALVVTSDEEIDVAAFPVPVVDTTGAGDAFVGNLAHALAQGQSLPAAARFATAAAALSVQRAGAQAGMPGAAETRRLLEEYT